MVAVAEGEQVCHEMQCVVPQRSVVGPLLWNIAYDGVLRLEYPEEVTVTAFADNLSLVEEGRNEDRVVL